VSGAAPEIAMQGMVTFRLNRECRDVAVNPAKVLYVCHYENGASQIHFSRECFIRVQGALSEVVHKIEVALCALPAGDPPPAELRAN
jgi:hypothetical protein